MRLLSVDFDFFFHEDLMWHWSHSETNPMLSSDLLWQIRASEFIRMGQKLPRTTGSEKEFWTRFNISSEARLYYADSHFNIARPEVIQGVTEIWNFDSHHDAYKKKSGVNSGITCENWVSELSSVAKIKNIVPSPANLNDRSMVKIERIVDTRESFKEKFDRIFVCRSSGWVPTWLECKFQKFIAECPVRKKIRVDNMVMREFSINHATELAKQTTKLMEIRKGGSKRASSDN